MRLFAMALATALAIPGMALADERAASDYGPKTGHWEGTLSGTGTSNNDFDNHNFGVSGSVGKYFTDNVLLGVRQSVNFADVAGSDDVINAATRGFVDYVFDLGRFRPYVGVSFGGIYGDGVNETLAAGPQGGLKFYADRHTFLFAQTEYQFTFDDVSDIDNESDNGQFLHTVGIGFNF